MDYEQKYKEALNRAKDRKENSRNLELLNFVDELFPELKESEDERIKKELISLLEWSKSYAPSDITTDEANEMIAWVKKYNEQSPDPYNGVSFEYNNHIWGMCARDNGVEILIDGEIKAFISLEKSFIYPTPLQSNGTSKVGIALEAIKEENVNNANKVESKESKFHEGEWVVSNVNKVTPWLIIEVTSTHYTMVSLPESKIKVFHSDIDNDYHLWSIADAKDGDVLISSVNKPFIYNGYFDEGSVGAYCGLYINDDFVKADKERYWTNNENIRPSTKEQRDFFFSKMKDAGYEWDTDKKKLKKLN